MKPHATASAALAVLLLCSCNTPVRDWFERYVETAEITGYEITPGDYETDASGNICLSQSTDYTITFTLRNPRNFKITAGENLDMTFPHLSLSEAEDTFGTKPDTEAVTIAQDEDDPTKLTMQVPKEFLKSTETGFNISPALRISHPDTGIDFGTYSGLRITSNSAPPEIESPGHDNNGAAVMTATENLKPYLVLCFNMPEKGLLKKGGMHHDIASITIYEKGPETKITVPITLADDGTYSFAGETKGTQKIFFNILEKTVWEISKEPPQNLAQLNTIPNGYTSSRVFKAGEQPVYFKIEIPQDLWQNDTFTVTLTDKAGLSTESEKITIYY